MPEREPQYQDFKQIQEITSELNQEGIVVLETNDSLLGRVGKLFSEKIKPVGKRIALPASAVILAVAAACTDGEGEPTPTATKIPTETPVPTATETATPTPEPVILLEEIEIPIPDLRIEKYSTKFKEPISEFLSAGFFEIKFDMFGTFGNEIVWDRSCGNSIIASGDDDYFLNSNSFHLRKQDGEYFQLNVDQDLRLLNQYDIKLYRMSPWMITCDDRVIYSVATYDQPSTLDRLSQIIVIADIKNQTKTVIRDEKFSTVPYLLTNDGSKLLLNFTSDQEPARGAYLVDLNNWQIIHHVVKEPGVKFNIIHMNEDGNLLHKSSIRQREFGESEDITSYLIDVTNGNVTRLDWPNRLSVFWFNALSPNLKYISRALGMFSAGGVVEGQWGMFVYTPNGYFQISSPNRTFHAQRIDNDGTIYTNRGEIFKFENGAYRLVSTGDGKPLDVDIVRIE